jgi:hypothetical protein
MLLVSSLPQPSGSILADLPVASCQLPSAEKGLCQNEENKISLSVLKISPYHGSECRDQVTNNETFESTETNGKEVRVKVIVIARTSQYYYPVVPTLSFA